MASSLLHQPSPRFSHCAAQIGHKTFLWGGRTHDFTASDRQKLASEIETFDVFHEKWESKKTTGLAPPGLYGGACTTVAEAVYHFGGYNGHSESNALHCLNSVTMEWTQVHSQTAHDRPMPKFGCGMTAYHKEDTTSLAVFAGHGIPYDPTQPGATFVQNRYTDGSGWTNEFHLFNLINGEWSSPPTTGPRPPPCAWFSFTAINHHMAVMFGGYQPEHGRVNDVYIIDFRSMEWTKLERPEGAPWPVERVDHAACCLNFGDVHPQLLVTGGVDKKGKTLSDAWLLDINTGRWRELTLPEGTQPRWGHTVTSFRLEEDRVHATTFGGCPSDFNPNRSLDDDPKLADTTVMEFESMKSSPYDGTRTREWVLMSVTGSSGLGTPERLKKLENVKQRRTEHAYQTWSGFPPGPTTVHPGIQFQLPLAADPNQGPWITPEFPTQLLAMHPPHLHQSTTLPVHKPTYQIYHPAQFTVPPTVPTLQPPYISGGYREMHPAPIPPIEPPLLPYHAQSILPHTTVLPSTQSEFHPVVSSTAAYQVASTTAAPSLQPSTHSASLDTAVSATSPHTTYSGRPLQESPLPRWASHTADIKPKVKQPSPKEKKPFLSDIKPKMEMLPKKELEGFKTEPKEEVGEDVKLKQVFSVSDVDKSGLVEEVAAKNKLLLGMISQLKEQIAEKDNEMNERDNQIAEKDEKMDEMYKQIADKDQQIADKDQQMAKLAEQNAEKNQQILEQAKQIDVKDEQTVKYQRMYEGLIQETQVHRKQPSEQAALTHGGTRTDVTTTEYLRGFETFAKTSFVIGSHSKTFEWQRYGLKLHIPEGAVRAEHTECRVDIKAGFTGQFNIPDDLQLVSCVYWLSCPQKFVKPVTLEIQHCASLQDSSQSSSLQFIVAKCSQAELPYQFRMLKKGIFVPGSSYGSIEVSQFSLFGISILKRAWRLWSHSYYSTLYYIRNNINNWDVDFVITLHLQAALAAIQDKYSTLYAIPGPGFEVQFESDTIRLAIPEDGVSLQNGWEITPLIAPVIEKQQVDGFKSWKEIPYCRLQVTLDKDRKPVKLKHKVKLLGAKAPHDFFTIICMAEEYFAKPAIRATGGKRKQLEGTEQDRPLKKRLVSDETSTVQKEAKILDTDTLANITHYLHSLDKTAIFNLGLVLGLDYNRLKTMTDSPSFLVDMLAGWIQRVDHVVETGVPTWTRLVKALKDPRVGQTGVADKIEQDKQ